MAGLGHHRHPRPAVLLGQARQHAGLTARGVRIGLDADHLVRLGIAEVLGVDLAGLRVHAHRHDQRLRRSGRHQLAGLRDPLVSRADHIERIHRRHRVDAGV
ncbi:hypothetical protein SDC9_82444 [bioreactor metagenome]|uniref:Uncharacterized protein n=1 Tax=bioreactor metagenome TaxID=1076179 RepID=A0A644Z4M4_9ZZZZ